MACLKLFVCELLRVVCEPNRIINLHEAFLCALQLFSTNTAKILVALNNKFKVLPSDVPIFVYISCSYCTIKFFVPKGAFSAKFCLVGHRYSQTIRRQSGSCVLNNHNATITCELGWPIDKLGGAGPC